MRKILAYPTIEQMAEAAADLFFETAITAIDRYGIFNVGLSGGSTPSLMFTMLAYPAHNKRLDWQKVHFFWADERCVPPEDPRSNYRLAQELLLDRIPAIPANVHRICGELPRDDGARRYEEEMRAFFHTDTCYMLEHLLDMLFLGIGEDGHTASLFPGSQVMDIRDRWVIGVEHRSSPDPQVDRISLTLPAINASRLVVFLVTGVRKAHILAQVLEPPTYQPLLPASRVHPKDGDLVWLIDAAAASALPETLYD
jgi:6-phosphogluconolactonase